MQARIEQALATLNCAAVIDHSGRGGNAFFLTTFDTHPQVLCCPLLHYSYSYVLSHFGEQTVIDAPTAKTFLKETSYFRLLCQDTHDNKALIYRMGADAIEIPYQTINDLVDSFMSTREAFTRKDLILLPFIFYALAFDKPLEDYRTVLISDAISLRHEQLVDGFSGQVIDCMLQDFKDAHLISIVRDIRAVFASPRHQFVNQLGNMYALKPGNFFSRLKSLIGLKLTPENSPVYLYWLAYLAQSTKTIYRQREVHRRHFMVVKNEDLNLHFLDTVQSLCAWLEVDPDPKWLEGDFMPTILGEPWQGTGAYNSRYQNKTDGLLKNDSTQQSQASAGPNRHVVERWKQKLNAMEKQLIEGLFAQEIKAMGYERLYPELKLSKYQFFKLIYRPFEGELPSWRWVLSGFHQSFKHGFERLYYTLVFGPFYLVSRWMLYRLVFKQAFFDIQLPSQTTTQAVRRVSV